MRRTAPPLPLPRPGTLIACGKTFLVTAATNGQIGQFNNNTVNLTGAGEVKLQGGIAIRNATFNVNGGILSLGHGGRYSVTVIFYRRTPDVSFPGGRVLRKHRPGERRDTATGGRNQCRAKHHE